ncbi:unnamed protein product [Schistosoma turkestanicum]|nr:unnamed protein product [Schistosoma turkestanicum]
MYAYLIVSILLIHSCNCGSKSSSSPECKKQKNALARFWGMLETLVGLICSITGIWNTWNDWKVINGTSTAATSQSDLYFICLVHEQQNTCWSHLFHNWNMEHVE